jgi:tRNA (guanine-N7-)-methyltransferase
MRKKSIRQLDLNNFSNVYNGLPTKINIGELVTSPSKSIILELACGRGEYTNGLGVIFPNKNFIGVDIKGERIWQAATRSKQLGLTNTGFLRLSIDQIEKYLEPETIDEILIIHPDPQPKKPRKRLTHNKFLQKYHDLLKKNGILKLKTDSKDLYFFTIDSLKKNWKVQYKTTDLHNSTYLQEHYDITTNFEQKAISRQLPIYYLVANKK